MGLNCGKQSAASTADSRGITLQQWTGIAKRALAREQQQQHSPALSEDNTFHPGRSSEDTSRNDLRERRRATSAPPSSEGGVRRGWAGVVEWDSPVPESDSDGGGDDEGVWEGGLKMGGGRRDGGNDDGQGGGGGGGAGRRRKERPVPSYQLPTAASAKSKHPNVQSLPGTRGSGSVTRGLSAGSGPLRRRPVPTETEHRRLQTRHRETRLQIMADKQHWARVKEQRREAAMESIASSRLADILRNSSAEDGHSRAPPSPTIDFVVHSSSSSAQVQAQRDREVRTGLAKRNRPRSVDVTSGASSLAIADAFLESQLGRELLEAQRMQRGRGDGEEGGEGYENERRGRQGGGWATGGPFGTDDEDEGGGRGEEDSSGAYFASGWKGTQGGWVADFGPPHTHALSIHSFDHPDDRRR